MSTTHPHADLPQPHADPTSPSLHELGRIGRPVVRRCALGFAAIVLAGIGVGLLLVHPLAGSALVRWDHQRIVALAAHRTSRLNSASKALTRAADAPGIIAIGAAIALVSALRRRWRIVALTAAALTFELATFLAINETVRRARPDGPHLGSVPSTGSFPSGHVEATVVVLGFVVLLLASGRSPRWLTVLASGGTAVAAGLVGWSRMYRGMHFPTDVLAGAVVGVAVLVVFRPLLPTGPTVPSRSRRSARVASVGTSETGQPAANDQLAAKKERP